MGEPRIGNQTRFSPLTLPPIRRRLFSEPSGLSQTPATAPQSAPQDINATHLKLRSGATSAAPLGFNQEKLFQALKQSEIQLAAIKADPGYIGELRDMALSILGPETQMSTLVTRSDGLGHAGDEAVKILTDFKPLPPLDLEKSFKTGLQSIVKARDRAQLYTVVQGFLQQEDPRQAQVGDVTRALTKVLPELLKELSPAERQWLVQALTQMAQGEPIPAEVTQVARERNRALQQKLAEIQGQTPQADPGSGLSVGAAQRGAWVLLAGLNQPSGTPFPVPVMKCIQDQIHSGKLSVRDGIALAETVSKLPASQRHQIRDWLSKQYQSTLAKGSQSQQEQAAFALARVLEHSSLPSGKAGLDLRATLIKTAQHSSSQNLALRLSVVRVLQGPVPDARFQLAGDLVQRNLNQLLDKPPASLKTWAADYKAAGTLGYYQQQPWALKDKDAAKLIPREIDFSKVADRLIKEPRIWGAVYKPALEQAFGDPKQAVAEQAGYILGSEFQTRLSLLPPDLQADLIQAEIAKLAVLDPATAEKTAATLAQRLNEQASAEALAKLNQECSAADLTVGLDVIRQDPSLLARVAGLLDSPDSVVANLSPSEVEIVAWIAKDEELQKGVESLPAKAAKDAKQLKAEIKQLKEERTLLWAAVKKSPELESELRGLELTLEEKLEEASTIGTKELTALLKEKLGKIEDPKLRQEMADNISNLSRGKGQLGRLVSTKFDKGVKLLSNLVKYSGIIAKVAKLVSNPEAEDIFDDINALLDLGEVLVEHRFESMAAKVTAEATADAAVDAVAKGKAIASLSRLKTLATTIKLGSLFLDKINLAMRASELADAIHRKDFGGVVGNSLELVGGMVGGAGTCLAILGVSNPVGWIGLDIAGAGALIDAIFGDSDDEKMIKEHLDTLRKDHQIPPESKPKPIDTSWENGRLHY